MGFIKKQVKRYRDKFAVTGKGIIGKTLYNYFPAENLKSLSETPISQKSAILDVGCGDGHLLKTLGELGYSNVMGIDPFIKTDIDYGNGLKILKKSIHEITGSYDLIMFHHSFEHIPDPAETLKAVYSLLNDSGRCIIRIPTATSYAWEHYRENWVQLDAPRHFFLHSAESMELLSSGAQMAVEKTLYDSTDFQFWGSEQYLKDIPLFDNKSYVVNPEASGFTKQEIDSFKERARILNREKKGDSAAFILKKK
jgi:SAM-dependent methyltransferase